MSEKPSVFRCPRCLYTAPRDSNVRFCPRCGLPDDSDAGSEEPFPITAGGEKFTVSGRLAFGDIANLYRCTIHRTGRTGVFKVARTHLSNRHIARESDTLKQLHDADREGRFTPFMPSILARTSYAHVGGEPARSASVLGHHDGIDGPDDLYTLEEVRAAYQEGIDQRDMAWMWRRLLTILGFVHQQRLVHGAVTPDHVLIEPREHKLLLVGWCGAVAFGQAAVLTPPRWRDWIRYEDGASPLTDLASAARTMSYLLGEVAEPAIKRHFQRAAESSCEAWRLMEDFDRMIEALWGRRQFRTFSMPARGQAKQEAEHG